jgi:hypothetical protein
MGRKSTTGGVTAAGPHQIQLTFKLEGVRYRPTLLRTPTEANLPRARAQLAGIKVRIEPVHSRSPKSFQTTSI